MLVISVPQPLQTVSLTSENCYKSCELDLCYLSIREIRV